MFRSAEFQIRLAVGFRRGQNALTRSHRPRCPPLGDIFLMSDNVYYVI
jgi:hypothetical protein